MDRGYKGKQNIGTTHINIPKPPLKKGADYQKREKENTLEQGLQSNPLSDILNQIIERQGISSKVK